MMSGKKKPSDIFGRIFLIVIILIIGVILGRKLVKNTQINLDSVRVVGKVKSKQTKGTVTESAWTVIVVEYTDHTGSKHQFEETYFIPILHSFAPDVGVRVSVKYSKSYQRTAMLDSIWKSFLLPFLVILFHIFAICLILKRYLQPT